MPQPRPGLPKPRFNDVLDDVLGLNLSLVMFWIDVLGLNLSLLMFWVDVLDDVLMFWVMF